ncbi:Transmembrane domain-containing protein [Spironucleus salmonicida]|uniref:Transmembrane domain-containing protein n=1 Tax=Spironucleus salmonicida TaxID=348837 RepID=V6LW98_9EUKA|nr:Transmembrane domain-containing protein [Spironucleus salmonicida]|eukprot:EST47986.1 Transmembrane domain-containing protein [Spironucleus salmonicida]
MEFCLQQRNHHHKLNFSVSVIITPCDQPALAAKQSNFPSIANQRQQQLELRTARARFHTILQPVSRLFCMQSCTFCTSANRVNSAPVGALHTQFLALFIAFALPLLGWLMAQLLRVDFSSFMPVQSTFELFIGQFWVPAIFLVSLSVSAWLPVFAQDGLGVLLGRF